MSKEVFVQFHAIYTDPENQPPLPQSMDDMLKGRTDYQTGTVRHATPDEIKKYNRRIKQEGPEAAKKWLTKLWE